MNTVSLKRIADIIAGQSPSSEDVEPYECGQPFLQGNAEFSAMVPIPRLQCSSAPKVAHPGDVLLSVRAPVGAVNIADQKYGIGRGLCAVRACAPVREYLWWYLQSQTLALRAVATGSTFEAVSSADVGSLEVPVLAPEHMSAIAVFLDREIAKIDALIAKQEQLIVTLREDRAATITQAITRGLDPNAEMTDSGVVWLGDMPAHWVPCRLKNTITSIESGTSVNGADIPASFHEVGVLKTSCVSAGRFTPEANKTVLDEDLARVSCQVKAGTLIVNRANTPALVGSAGYVAEAQENLYLSDKLWRVTFDRALAEFIYRWTATNVYRAQIAASCVGASSSMQNLSMTDFQNIALALPPVQEQRQIVDYLDDRCTKVDALIEKSTEMIEVLCEYRSVLITDAVTGKIDVRGQHDELSADDPGLSAGRGCVRSARSADHHPHGEGSRCSAAAT